MPSAEVLQMEYRNPNATKPLYLPVLVMSNTPDAEIRHNVKTNAARDLEWLAVEPEHDGIAVMVGGGASADEFLDEIALMQRGGATVFAMNAASKWLYEQGVTADWQCMLDAKKESATLVDLNAKAHLLASQCHPATVEAVPNPVIWHVGIENVEQDFPPEKVEAGGYALLGGGSGVGNSAVCAAYALGYREFHVFGFDSCHTNGASHAYSQPMNDFIPTCQVKWGDRVFTASVAMKVHAERFQVTSQKLKQLGCKIITYGDGLLQSMYNAKPGSLKERDKYQTLWQFERYRAHSPGLHAVPEFLRRCSPSKDDIIIDYGCGTGKASAELARLGYQVFLVDFTDNCRDEEALGLPFLEWDLTRHIPVSAPFGFCCDVMEHIPLGDVVAVLRNIMASARETFFQISTIDDSLGETIGHTLHLTVRPFEWWRDLFAEIGCDVTWSDHDDISCQIRVRNRNAS